MRSSQVARKLRVYDIVADEDGTQQCLGHRLSMRSLRCARTNALSEEISIISVGTGVAVPAVVRVRILLACLIAAACSGASAETPSAGDDDDEGPDETPSASDASSTPPPDSGLGVLRLSPSREYSGFDGQHAFKVPIAVYGSNAGDDVTLAPDEAGSAVVTKVKLAGVSAADDSGLYYLVEVKKAGSLKLTAKASGQSASATVSVAEYEAAQWETGRTRYENAGANGEPACASCHVNGKAIDNSPAALASVTDADVGRIMTLGVKPSRATISTGCTDCSEAAKKHQWTLTDDERRGLIVYLRALDPRGFE